MESRKLIRKESLGAPRQRMICPPAHKLNCKDTSAGAYFAGSPASLHPVTGENLDIPAFQRAGIQIRLCEGEANG